MTDVPVPPGSATSGHRSLRHAADCIVEAWAPDRATCVTEALVAMVESFAEVADVAATRSLPLAAGPGGPDADLVDLLVEVISTVDVLDVVPVRFHLAETEDGGIAGDMEVVPSEGVVVVGPVPKGVSFHDLSCATVDGGWRCHVLLDV